MSKDQRPELPNEGRIVSKEPAEIDTSGGSVDLADNITTYIEILRRQADLGDELGFQDRATTYRLVANNLDDILHGRPIPGVPPADAMIEKESNDA